MDDAGKFKLIAGHVALDFANTLDDRYNPSKTKDLLVTYDDLLLFGRITGAVKRSHAKALREKTEEEKYSALLTARRVREALEKIFSSLAREEAVPIPALRLLNAHLRRALAHRILMQNKAGGFRWKWVGSDTDALAPLWPILAAAGELLQSDESRFVRQCSSETCRWLFLDLSKNHSRRWCDMKLCGNRLKARRFYERKQGEEGQTQPADGL